MISGKKIPLLLLTAICTALLLPCSCNDGTEEVDAVYLIDDNTSALALGRWHVVGPFTAGQDSVMLKNMLKAPTSCQRTTSRDTSMHLWYNGVFQSKYGSPDLKEVFSINVNDTTKQLDTLVTYLTCTLKAVRERNMFLLVDTKMQYEQYLNGKRLEHKHLREIEVYPFRLHKGDNTLFVKATGGKNRYWYKATLLDSVTMARLYAEQHTGEIIMPIIRNDSIMLTEAHWDVTNAPVKLTFHDVNARKAAETVVQKGEMSATVQGLEKDRTYICSTVIAGDTIQQPVMTWQSAEEAEQTYTAMRDTMFMMEKPVFFQAGERNPRADEIDNLLYRLWKLNTITGKMREDYWFDFKLPWVIYQLEHTFAHLDETYGNCEGENNFKFMTYRSTLDGGTQRYVLITPNRVDYGRKYPLLVVVRPSNEKRYHLFFCPQIAHQYAVNDMIAIANRYDTFIIMPEARMLLDEDLTPFAEAEMKLALTDVQEHYNIDADRIFLHSNCFGGYRALRLAELNPEMFAGVALYAPVYHRSDGKVNMSQTPESMVGNLRNIPLFIYGDPADTHSPVKFYADLIMDCKKHGVKYELKMQRNTGQGQRGYHRMVVGRDACDFFQDKVRKYTRNTHYSFPVRDTAIADFYSKPFVYVYNSVDTSAVYRQLVDSIRNEYEGYLYAKLPLVPDGRVTQKMLSEKNVFLIGKTFRNPIVHDFACKVSASVPVCRREETMLAATKNPIGKNRMVLLYASHGGTGFIHSINFPWKDCFHRVELKRNK